MLKFGKVFQLFWQACRSYINIYDLQRPMIIAIALLIIQKQLAKVAEMKVRTRLHIKK